MTQDEYNTLTAIAYDEGQGFATRPRLREFLKNVSVVEEALENTSTGTVEPHTRSYTSQQRNAAWLYMDLKSDQLNMAGLDMRVVLKPSYHISWTKDNFHDHVWIPIQKALFGTESMTKLAKDQPGRIHELIEREINEKHGTEYIPFPNFNMKLTAMENLENDAYPSYEGKTAFE